MKIKLFTILALSLLAVLPMKAVTSFGVLQVEDKKDIELKGDMEDDRQKSLVFPFGAYQVDNTEVCVVSYDTHSATTISIVDVRGATIDSCSSSLSSQQVVSFDVSNYANGIYTLVITTPQGTYLTGTFEIE